MSEQTQQAIGKVLTGSEQRDAIHFAVAPVVAAERLSPGQHVGFVQSNQDGVGSKGVHIGIVDPFLEGPVFPGERCWLFLYPNTITALRHNWTHPAFIDSVPANVSASEAWLRVFADDMELSYAALLSAADGWLETGAWHTFNHDTPDRAYTDREEFWHHYEVVTGKKVSDKSEMFFTCSC